MFLMELWTIIIIIEFNLIELLLKSISFKTGQHKSIQTAFRSFGEGNSSPEYTSWGFTEHKMASYFIFNKRRLTGFIALFPSHKRLWIIYRVVGLGGLAVIVLVTGLKVPGSNLDKDDGFLRAIKICSTTSFGREVKPSAPCRKAEVLTIRRRR
jgi:hypothetical protein